MTNAAEAFAELRRRAREFADVEGRIIELQRQTNDVQRAARDRGDDVTENQARETQQRLRALFEKYRATRAEWDRLVGLIPGLGVVPVIYAGAVIALATTVLFILTRVDAEERIVRLLERGELTPDETESLLAATEGGADVFGGLGETAKWLGFALLGYLGFRVWKDYVPR